MISFATYDQEYLKKAAIAIYQNKTQFDFFIKENQRLSAVKLLKELTGGGLKEAKDAYELYCVGKLPNCIKEERKDKLIRLEQLAKSPLIEELIPKIKELTDSDLRLLLMKLSIDKLLSIDNLFIDEKFEKMSKTDFEKLTDLINDYVMYIVDKLEKLEIGKERFNSIDKYVDKKSPLYKMIYDELNRRLNERLSNIDPSIFPDDLFKNE